MRMKQIIAPPLLLIFILIAFAPYISHAQEVPRSQEQIKLSYAPVVKKVAPAVVNIYTKRVVTRQAHPFANDPFFAPFFGQRGFGVPKQRVESSLGSGVIITPTGRVITNAHVIQGASEIIIGLADGREFEAKVVLSDEHTDLAVLNIHEDVQNLPFAPLRPSENLEVGDLVLAIGNPFGVGQTVTSGIISALARSAVNINDYNFFIQTDAAINPGNSGGPLIAMDGGVIGINTAIFSRSGGSLGIGFAIPSEMVNTVIAAAETNNINEQGVIRPWLGATFQTLTSDLAESFDMDRPGGALITELHSRSPLKQAGLQIGDVIIALNEKPLRDPGELKFRMATIPLGEKAEITILQNGMEEIVTITAQAPPEDPPRNTTTLSGKHPLHGLEVSNINPALSHELGLTEETGVVVSGGNSQNRFFNVAHRGDIIVAINGEPISSVKTLQNILDKMSTEGRNAWQITMNRQGQVRQVVVR